MVATTNRARDYDRASAAMDVKPRAKAKAATPAPGKAETGKPSAAKSQPSARKGC
jgi:hypothetical protein